MKTFFFLACLVAALFSSAQETSSYSIVKKISIPGDDGFWDYLSIDSNGRLYVSHGSVVQIVDTKSGKLAATIDGLNGVHGIALAEKLNQGFISSGRDSMIIVFNLNTDKVIDKVKSTGANPDAILFDPFSNKVFAFNGRSSDATVIDAVTHKVVATIALEGKPEFSAADGHGKVYVNIEDKSLITCIDSKALKVLKSWSIAPGEEPSGLAADFEHQKLFSVCGNKLMTVFDLKTEKVITTLPIGGHTDGAGFDGGLGRAYSSNGEGTLTVVQENGDQFTVLASVPTQQGARTICVDPKTHHIFLPTAEFEPRVEGQRRPKAKPGSFMVLEIAPK